MLPEHEVILKRAESKYQTLSKFLKQLGKKNIQRFDRIVQEIHDEVFSGIDCTECANCCRHLGPKFNTTDIERFAGILRMKPSVFVKNYLQSDEDEDLVLQALPCPFLGDDNICMEYDARPRACRNYPHTDEKHMHGRKMHILAENIRYCPAALLVAEKLYERFG